MKAIRLLATSALLLGAISNTHAASILHTDTYGGHVYKLIGDDSGSRISWTDAEAAAVGMGGHLVTINDAAENAFVLNAFGAAAASAAPADGGLLSLWLGLSDFDQEGVWSWADNTPVSFTNWHFGEPAGGNTDEDFAGLTVYDWWPGTAGQWHDIISDWRFNDVVFGVVEMDATPVPLPGTLGLFCAGMFALGFVRARKKILSRI